MSNNQVSGEQQSSTLAVSAVSWRRNKKISVAIVFITIFLGIGYAGWQFFGAPAQGTVRVSLPAQAERVTKNDKEWLYKGNFFEFSLPLVYVEKKHTFGKEGPIQESVYFSTQDIEGKKIALTLSKRGSTDLAEEPSFRLRETLPMRYVRSSLQGFPFQGVIFTKKELPFEITVFFVQKEFIVSISITSPFGDKTLLPELLSLLATFRVLSEDEIHIDIHP